MKMNKKAWKVAVVSVGALFCLTPAVSAATNPNFVTETAAETHSQEMPLQLAQSYCPDTAGGGPMVDYFETDNFWIYICAADGLYYHGVSKGDYSYVTLPVYAEEGTGYVAVNGDYTYIVNGAALSIYEGRTLLQEDSVY